MIQMHDQIKFFSQPTTIEFMTSFQININTLIKIIKKVTPLHQIEQSQTVKQLQNSYHLQTLFFSSPMKNTQRLKQQVFKEVQASGLFKQVQSKLKTEVLNLVEKQSNQNKKLMGFQYQHPLLSKLRKYPLTSLCMDLIQEFLESFKFKYTLSVFRKEINRETHNMNRMELANNFNIEMKNPQNQAVLLSLVSQLVSGQIKLNHGKQNNAFAATNKSQSSQGQPRVNNFIANENTKPSQTAPTNFIKKPSYTEEPQNSSINGKLKSDKNPSLNNPTSQQQSSSSSNNQSASNGQPQSQIPTSSPTSSLIQPSVKPSQNSVSEMKEQSEVKESKDDKNKKNKKKKQVEKPPEGATDLMGELMGKFKTKDTKAEQESKKNKIFEEKRTFSEQKAKKVVDPSESGANKIRGVSMGKMTNFMSKFMPQTMNTAKNESYVEEDLDEFQQSRDSTRKNPLYSSSESGFDKSGYYDMSVDSNAINDFEYVEKAKKFAKKM